MSVRIKDSFDTELEMAVGELRDMANVVTVVLESYDSGVYAIKDMTPSSGPAFRQIEPGLGAVLFSFFQLRGMIGNLQRLIDNAAEARRG
jgi:hypothetical protein